jgi:hypothetical protein
MFARSMIALLVLMAACSVGAVEGPAAPDAPPSPNELSFETTMKPLLMPKCTACHAGGQPPTLTSYGGLASNPLYTQKPGTGNILVTKDGGTGQHPVGVPYFTEAEKMTVANWIQNLQ